MPAPSELIRRTIWLLLFGILFTDAGSLLAQDTCAMELDKKDQKEYQIGVTNFKRGNFIMAARVMREMVNRYPEQAEAWFILGSSYIKRRDSDFNTARGYLRKVLEICPNYDPYVYYYLGEIAYSNENFEATISYLT